MNGRRRDKATEGLNTQAMKVLEVVPIKEKWKVTAILAEMKKTGAGQPGISVVQGCLKELIQRRLVQGSPDAGYRQVKTRRPVLIGGAPVLDETSEIKSSPEQARSPLVVVGELTEKMANLQSDFEDAALEIAEYMQSFEAKADMLKKLQALLEGVA